MMPIATDNRSRVSQHLRLSLLRSAFAGIVIFLLPTHGEAGFQDAYIQTSVFHRPGYSAFDTNGYGVFGVNYSGVLLDFSWGDQIVQPGGPEVTSAWAGFRAVVTHDVAGYDIKGGTGIWQSGGNGF